MYPVTRVGPHPALSLHERCLLLTKLLFSDQGPYFVDITARIALGACGTEFRPVLPEWTSELHRYSCWRVVKDPGIGGRSAQPADHRSIQGHVVRGSRASNFYAGIASAPHCVTTKCPSGSTPPVGVIRGDLASSPAIFKDSRHSFLIQRPGSGSKLWCDSPECPWRPAA